MSQSDYDYEGEDTEYILAPKGHFIVLLMERGYDYGEAVEIADLQEKAIINYEISRARLEVEE